MIPPDVGNDPDWDSRRCWQKGTGRVRQTHGIRPARATAKAVSMIASKLSSLGFQPSVPERHVTGPSRGPA
jgi:hypothetical protein